MQPQAVPEIPDGPLVISAGWGRTGTSSLKVSDFTLVLPYVEPGLGSASLMQGTPVLNASSLSNMLELLSFQLQVLEPLTLTSLHLVGTELAAC